MKWIVLAFSLLLAVQVNARLQVDVFCTSKVKECRAVRNDIKRLRGVDVKLNNLDETLVISEKWSEKMRLDPPKTEQEGVDRMSRWMNSHEGRKDMEKMASSVKAIERVVLSNIEKLPAFICEDKYVVYGGTLSEALKLCIEAKEQK
ncbi:DUF1525 domain-containing protein [Vibrio harveyi]|uniref:DUF1525 domain-containing protein n=1 Tax=Vibrio harveyi TaxID=669 RepID=UPI001EFDAABE|nr:DUF1525 domain-containing protein [Vibrio harveyi]MCG9589952.1 DUF1525 domain-containing protein [Vibrio harveyi]MCG9670355.1 DUF1525 domain-containing protein [Vibrio harveyi]WJT11000.1 DUF1525 domain-containing protein [Vibrio harveyi]